MLRVDPEPFESLTAQKEIEGRLFLPRSSERGLSVVEGPRNPGIPRMLNGALPGREKIAYLCRSKRLKGMA